MNELAIVLKEADRRPLYQQIYEYIRDEIREGKLLWNEKLPSTRNLAQYLQISRSTVDLAYQQLTSEGYIEARPCRGYFVCRVEELYHLSQKQEREKQEKEEMGEKYTFDFSPNGMDMSHFPFSVWRKITKNILSEGRSNLFSLGSPQGDEELRTTIARYLHSSRGVDCLPEQIVVGAGNDYLLMMLEKILGSDTRIAMENSSYRRAYQIFNSFGYQVELIPMDEKGMKTEELQKSETNVAYLMPAHQFPTGIVMPIGRRLELLKWAKEMEGRYIIEDDYDSEFRYKGKPIPSLHASDQWDKVIYIGTFSKSIAPAIRISFLVLPMSLVEVYRKNCFFYSSTVSRIDQTILNEFIKGGYFERHLNRMRKIYKGKHDKVLEGLQPFRKKFLISGENVGLYVVLHPKGKEGVKELTEAAARASIRVYGRGELFPYCETTKDDGILIGYGGMSEEEIAEGLRKLSEVWLK